MLNITPINSSAQAGNYYTEKDDYYSEEGSAPSEWYGHGAERDGLHGEVDPEEFIDALKEAEGRGRRTGFDLTFSADKTVSLVGLAGGNKAVIDAHDRAVEKALDYVEDRVGVRIHTRDGPSGEQMTWQKTGEMTSAVFRHSTNRNLEPNLHSHAAVINRTHDAAGQDRALNSDDFRDAARNASQIYQTELDAGLRRAGFATEKQQIKGLTVTRMRGVSDELRNANSSRAEEVTRQLRKMGLTRETATRAQREYAALETRHAKEHVDHDTLVNQWRAEAHALGRESELSGTPREAPMAEWIEHAADLAVRHAAEHLGERQSRFSEKEFERQALGEAVGSGAGLDDIREAMERANERGELLERITEAYRRSIHKMEPARAFTTKENVAIEREMVAAEQAGRGKAKPLMSEAEAWRKVDRYSKNSKYRWNAAQERAAVGILSSKNLVTGLQGYAGTAKTTTAMDLVAQVAREQGKEVVGLAPSASATHTLDSNVKLDDARTVSSYLARMNGKEESRRLEAGQNDGDSGRVVIVDEASFLSSRDMDKLLEYSAKAGDRVILTGDVRQLGSVEAGDAFRQLQEGGMTTHVLDQIVRQTNEHTLGAVEGVLARDAEQALDALRGQPDGGIRETTEKQRGQKSAERRDEMAADYLKLSWEERERTILIDPTRAGRDDLNEKIREGLKEEGVVRGPEIDAKTLTPKDMTTRHMQDVSRYERGDVVIFTSDRKREDIQEGVRYTVTGTDQESGRVLLRSEEGQERDLKASGLGRGKANVYHEKDAAIAEGDRVRWTRNDNDAGLKNGDSGRVQAVDADKKTALVEFGKGDDARMVDVDLSRAQTMDRDYATTAHSAQGKTADNVMIHAESWRGTVLDNRSMYVSISRAREEVTLYTDNAAALRSAIEFRSGERELAAENERDREAAEERGEAAHTNEISPNTHKPTDTHEESRDMDTHENQEEQWYTDQGRQNQKSALEDPSLEEGQGLEYEDWIYEQEHQQAGLDVADPGEEKDVNYSDDREDAALTHEEIREQWLSEQETEQFKQDEAEFGYDSAVDRSVERAQDRELDEYLNKDLDLDPTEEEKEASESERFWQEVDEHGYSEAAESAREREDDQKIEEELQKGGAEMLDSRDKMQEQEPAHEGRGEREEVATENGRDAKLEGVPVEQFGKDVADSGLQRAAAGQEIAEPYINLDRETYARDEKSELAGENQKDQVAKFLERGEQERGTGMPRLSEMLGDLIGHEKDPETGPQEKNDRRKEHDHGLERGR